MADEIVQGGPSITEPTVLTPEAMKAADASLLARISAAPTRPRGRPPGSKNKPKVDPETGQVKEPTRRPSSRSNTPTQPTPKQTAEQKTRAAKEWQEKILGEANDILMDTLIGFGIPAQVLYKNPPAAKAVNDNYTDLGRRLAIKPNHAKVWAYTIVELQGSDIGGRAAEVVSGDSPIRLIALGLMSLGAAGQYVKSLMDLRKELEPQIAMLRQYQEAQKQAAQAASNKQQVPDGQAFRGQDPNHHSAATTGRTGA